MSENVGVYIGYDSASTNNYGFVCLCGDCAQRLGEQVEQSKLSYSSEQAACRECGATKV